MMRSIVAILSVRPDCAGFRGQVQQHGAQDKNHDNAIGPFIIRQEL